MGVRGGDCIICPDGWGDKMERGHGVGYMGISLRQREHGGFILSSC